LPIPLDGPDAQFHLDRLGPRRSSYRILLADDDLDMRTLLASALRQDGYDVVEIADGSELFQTVYSWLRHGNGRGIDAIVTDIRMPAFSGLEVLAELRSRYTTLPVILITAFGDQQTHAEARALGAYAVFDKPFDVDDLRTVLLNALPPRRF
jgi:CheY-like chemotaxis protein